MDTYSSMRIGFLAPSYPVPAVIQESGRIDWLIDKAHELGCSCLDRPRINDTPEERRRVRSLLEREGIEIECSARGVFDLASPESKRRGRSELEASITTASELGAGIIRTGYGKLTVATSRYSREIPIAEHLAIFTRCLVEAAEIMEGTGVLLAIENHCDFTGRELASVLDTVGSPSIGAALDTANGFTVFSDPADDIEVLSPHAFTTHMKDMRLVQNPETGMPYVPIGCPLGEGFIDFRHAVSLLARESPCADGLHLVVETGWEDVPDGMTAEERRIGMIETGTSYLRMILTEASTRGGTE